MERTLRPQPGPQEDFLASTADIVVYGGAAGGGKTYGLLLETLRHANNPDFGAVIFRREGPQITNEGALWDESEKMFSCLATPRDRRVWTFRSGAQLQMSHMEHEDDRLAWQGSQIALICCETTTEVAMSDGTFRQILAVRPGDMVLTLNGSGRVTSVGRPRMEDCVECVVDGGGGQVQSRSHKLLTSRGWISYDDVCSGLSSLRLDSVVLQNQTHLLADGLGKSQKYIHHGLRYAHPYMRFEQISEEIVSFSSVSMIPCGKREVVDITVEPQCHYVTRSGLVNKNCFDELTHFTAKQFWYLVSRNRSTCGVRPYIRCTCNPDPDSFVADMISWWIDRETGYAIPERSGVIRYFVRISDELHWASSAEELEARYPDACFEYVEGERLRTGPKSFTFISSSVLDNKILMKMDPGYIANLRSMPTVERERLLKGNWSVRDERTVIFKPSWWKHWGKEKKDQGLPDVQHVFASWDTAFTAQDQRITREKRPDLDKIAFSACTVWGVWFDDSDVGTGREHGTYKLLMLAAWWGRVDWPDLRAKVTEIEKKFLTHADDAHLIEKAASGHSLISDLRKAQKAVRCRVIGVPPTRGDGKVDAKVLRAYLGQTYHRDGYLWVPDRPWVPEVISWLSSFPGGLPPSADLADTVSMAIQYLSKGWWIHHPDDDIPHEPVVELTEEDEEDMPVLKRVVGYG